MAVLNARAVGGFLNGHDVNESKTVQVHDLGTRFRDHVGREFMMVRAAAAITGQGYVLAIDADNDALMLTTAILDTFSEWLGACATNGAPADNDYLWMCTQKPPGDTELGIFTAASSPADLQLFSSGTAGMLSSAASGTPIEGVRLLTATGGSNAVNTASEWDNMKRGQYVAT